MPPVEPRPEPEPVVGGPPRCTRRVRSDGRVSLLRFTYHVGRWLVGETVDLVSRDGLIEIFHGDVLVATHARRHLPEHERDLRRETGPRASRPATTGHPVTRKVDNSGSISFAGWNYRVGNTYRRRQAQVVVIGDTVQISYDSKLVRTHPIRHNRTKEHGAFANPSGRPRRINAA